MSLRHAALGPGAKWLPGVMVFVSMLAVSVPVPAFAHSLSELERQLTEREAYVEFVDRAAPDFALEDASGHAVRLQDLREKVVVLWFIYASCPDVCPLQSEAIAAIQKMVNQTPMRDRVTFVSITTDPARDTSQVLKDYGPSHGLDPVNWLFLTSGENRPDATRGLADRFGLKFTLTPDGEQMHGVVTHLIDKSGHIRARYHSLKFNKTSVLLYINALTNDYH
jgi:protein SCO1/2